MITIRYLDSDGTGACLILDSIMPHHTGSDLSVYDKWLANYGGRWVNNAGWTYDIVFDNDDDAVVFKLKYGV